MHSLHSHLWLHHVLHQMGSSSMRYGATLKRLVPPAGYQLHHGLHWMVVSSMGWCDKADALYNQQPWAKRP